MAKTDFDWSGLPAGLRTQLAQDIGIASGDVVDALAARFGEVPTERFVKEAWPALRDRWLAEDHAVLHAVASELRAHGLGATAIAGDSAAAQLAYLRSCRNAPTLRTVVLSHLLALGGARPHAPVAAGAPSAVRDRGLAGDDAGSAPAREPAELREQVRVVLGAVLGVDDLRIDPDGDIAIPSSASLTFVRVLRDAPIVRVFSPVLWGFGAPADIEETVNDINRRTNWVKAVWEHGAVVLVSDVVGQPLAEPQLAAAVLSVVRRANEIGPRLQQRYGGTTAVGAPVPPRHARPVGGYL